jgi:hypothetical protein
MEEKRQRQEARKAAMTSTVEPVVTSLVTEETSSAAQVYKSSLIEVFGRYFTVLGEILSSFF